MSPYNVLFLDLDGTLLDIDVSFFLGPMVREMHAFFSDSLGRERFRKGLFGGTEAIMAQPRQEGQTNEEGFFGAFSEITGMSGAEAKGRFDDFYSRSFPALGSFARPVEGGPEFVSAAMERGYDLVLATNPIFPVTATRERVRWAGIDPRVFRFIPGLENMSSCKPSPRFFLDLASRTGFEPATCLMIGNDPQQDLPAADAGMGTFLLQGQMIRRGEVEREPHATGTLEELARMLGIG